MIEAATVRSRFEPHRVALENENGEVLNELLQPRSSFQGHTLETPWSDFAARILRRMRDVDLSEYSVSSRPTRR